MIFIARIVIIPLEQKTNLSCIKKHAKIKIFAVMPSGDAKILEFNQYQKSNKAPFINNEDFECIIEKIHRCKNNPEDSSTIKVSEHIPSVFSMSTIFHLEA